MNKFLLFILTVILIHVTLGSQSTARTGRSHMLEKYQIASPPARTAVPPRLAQGYPAQSRSANDTLLLAWFDFDTNGQPDAEGWISVDHTEQFDTYFHIADATELDGGQFLAVAAGIGRFSR